MAFIQCDCCFCWTITSIWPRGCRTSISCNTHVQPREGNVFLSLENSYLEDKYRFVIDLRFHGVLYKTGLLSIALFLHWEATLIPECWKHRGSSSWRGRALMDEQIWVQKTCTWTGKNDDFDSFVNCVVFEICSKRIWQQLNPSLLQLSKYIKICYQMVRFKGASMLQKPVDSHQIIDKTIETGASLEENFDLKQANELYVHPLCWGKASHGFSERWIKGWSV